MQPKITSRTIALGVLAGIIAVAGAKNFSAFVGSNLQPAIAASMDRRSGSVGLDSAPAEVDYMQLISP